MMIIHHICHKHVYIIYVYIVIETWVKVSVVRPDVPAWLLPGQEAHAAQVSRRFFFSFPAANDGRNANV